jgi:hypothetical protein
VKDAFNALAPNPSPGISIIKKLRWRLGRGEQKKQIIIINRI